MAATITKYQRHPTEDDTVIVHLCDSQAGDCQVQVKNQDYRDALEAAEKLED